MERLRGVERLRGFAMIASEPEERRFGGKLCRASKEITRAQTCSAERERQKRPGLRDKDRMHTLMTYRS